MKATGWFVTGLVLSTIAMFSFAAMVLVTGDAEGIFEAVGITSVMASGACYLVGQRKQ